MVLVDTSSWIETLRARGDAAVRQRVADLVLNGTAAWCEMIRLELWHGVRDDAEKKNLQQLEAVVQSVPIDQEVWDRSIALGIEARRNGLTVPSPDLVIVATAIRHGLILEHVDQHLARLTTLR